MKDNPTMVALILCIIFTGLGIASDGSNLGSQATHYEPPAVTGTIAFGASPGIDAKIQTLAGQRAVTNAAGEYFLTLDAPGIYRISVRAMLNVHLVIVEVFLDQTLTLNIDLGTPCEIEPWPASETVAQMISCLNNSQPETQP